MYAKLHADRAQLHSVSMDGCKQYTLLIVCWVIMNKCIMQCSLPFVYFNVCVQVFNDFWTELYLH